MESALELLFESVAKIRIMRLFLQNPEQVFAFSDISGRTQVKASLVSRELAKLIKGGIVRQKMGKIREDEPGMANKKSQKKDQRLKKKKNPKSPGKTAKLYFLNVAFPLLVELRELVLKSAATDRKRLLQQIKRLGKIRLAILSGVFINNDNTRTDLFIVGDDIKQRVLERFLATIESELGKPIQYTIMEFDEYKYRLNMYDRFIRDIMERPHEKLINKMHV